MTPSREWCDAEGARILKKRIEEFWREQGLEPEVRLIDRSFHPAMRSARVDVRSEMINGQPVKRHYKQEEVRQPQCATA